MKKILLVSFNNGEIRTRMRELGFSETIMQCSPNESYVYDNVMSNRPNLVFIDTCINENLIEKIVSSIEDAKWSFDIDVNTALIGPELSMKIPGVYLFKSFEEAREELGKIYAQ
ncbi:hypothetical protein IT402_00755 [Candidatus Nomurabacteria bacterium]|nr:hypothetical protein [Candidatus Nomurabacteria bacterium]